MIQNEFEYLGRAMTKAMCKRNTRFIVQALDHAAVILAFGAEIVEQEFLMGAKHAGYLFHRFNPRAHGAGGPCFQVSGRPGRTAVEPEAPEAFLEFPGSGRGPERSENRVEFGPGLASNLGGTFQQQEAPALGAGALLLGAQSPEQQWSPTAAGRTEPMGMGGTTSAVTTSAVMAMSASRLRRRKSRVDGEWNRKTHCQRPVVLLNASPAAPVPRQEASGGESGGSSGNRTRSIVGHSGEKFTTCPVQPGNPPAGSAAHASGPRKVYRNENEFPSCLRRR